MIKINKTSLIAAAMDTGSGGIGERRASDSPVSASAAAAASGDQSGSGQQAASADTGGPIRATASMWRCSRIMHFQRDLHPTVLSSLEGKTCCRLNYLRYIGVMWIYRTVRQWFLTHDLKVINTAPISSINVRFERVSGLELAQVGLIFSHYFHVRYVSVIHSYYTSKLHWFQKHFPGLWDQFQVP